MGLVGIGRRGVDCHSREQLNQVPCRLARNGCLAYPLVAENGGALFRVMATQILNYHHRQLLWYRPEAFRTSCYKGIRASTFVFLERTYRVGTIKGLL
jgi:hypothetical protein